MKRIVLAFGSATALLLSHSVMAAPAEKAAAESSCSCGEHKEHGKGHGKKHAKKGKQAAAACEHCGMTECSCSEEACAKCEHCQGAKAEGRKDGCDCAKGEGHGAKKASSKAD